MTKDQLMRPRYKVIANYPGSFIEVGEIINPAGTDVNHPFYGQLDKYPHLFRKLEWWEDRKLEEMPEYVRVNTERTCLFIGQILRIKMWGIRPAGHLYCLILEDNTKSHPDLYRYDADVFLPATETEYNEYQ